MELSVKTAAKKHAVSHAAPFTFIKMDALHALFRMAVSALRKAVCGPGAQACADSVFKQISKAEFSVPNVGEFSAIIHIEIWLDFNDSSRAAL